ncbi:DNA polymerase III subunit delta [Vagococcus penaei]|uniref:DNA polymerase III subunit delta n=1 Tax=Vagococcus penaei TaxID=633807 RepID=A0A1Q2D4C4_9ENTE|nr:DNA polymerase III subunit delta [Vagococcus penaei]AQP53232.1 DNA polymerase III subunit delta [Vagococcus penaei]RST98677.1 DNA polymerase III subunit delta [Vagococcus penaei]
MSIQTELAKIKKQQIAPIYVLQGTESFLIDEFITTLKQTILTPDDEAFNVIRFNMEETELAVAIEEAEMMPFFGDYKLIIIDQPYFFTGEKRKNELIHQTDSLLNYLKEPSPTSVIVFIAPYQKFDERKKTVKLLKKEAIIVNTMPLSEKETKKYVADYINNEGFGIHPKTFDYLCYLCDMNLSRLMNELDKLFLYAQETKDISMSAVKELVPKSLEHNIFDMVNYVMSGKQEEALQLYEDLLKQGEETIKINAILISQFRLYLQVKLLLSIHYQQSNMVDMLKVHPYRVKLACQQVKRFSIDDLGNIFDQLVENDFKFKTGFMDQKLLFELFILGT